MTKKVKDDKLGEKMEALAEKLADDLKDGKDIKKTASDTFGRLTSYYAATRKLNLKVPDPDDEGATFDKFRETINGPAISATRNN